MTIFALVGNKMFPVSKLSKIGFYGLGHFYGLATVIVGVFPCDRVCNKEFIDPSTSQITHNITGFLTYIFVTLSIILIGLGLKNHLFTIDYQTKQSSMVSHACSLFMYCSLTQILNIMGSISEL